MICPKCGNKAIQSRQFDSLDQRVKTELTTCILCGMILADEPVVNVSERDMSVNLFVTKQVKQCRADYPYTGKNCKVAGCESRQSSLGFCNRHYQQTVRYRRQLEKLRFSFDEVLDYV